MTARTPHGVDCYLQSGPVGAPHYEYVRVAEGEHPHLESPVHGSSGSAPGRTLTGTGLTPPATAPAPRSHSLASRRLPATAHLPRRVPPAPPPPALALQVRHLLARPLQCAARHPALRPLLHPGQPARAAAGEHGVALHRQPHHRHARPVRPALGGVG
jgi:hypothetical protein